MEAGAAPENLIGLVREVAASDSSYDALGRAIEPLLESVIASLGLDPLAPNVLEHAHRVIQQRLYTFDGSTSAEFRAWVAASIGTHLTEILRYGGAPADDTLAEASLDSTITSPGDETTATEVVRWSESLARLAPDDQTVLRLRFYEQLAWDVIAEQMHRDFDAVRILYYQAIERWRREYEGGT